MAQQVFAKQQTGFGGTTTSLALALHAAHVNKRPASFRLSISFSCLPVRQAVPDVGPLQQAHLNNNLCLEDRVQHTNCAPCAMLSKAYACKATAPCYRRLDHDEDCQEWPTNAGPCYDAARPSCCGAAAQHAASVYVSCADLRVSASQLHGSSRSHFLQSASLHSHSVCSSGGAPYDASRWSYCLSYSTSGVQYTRVRNNHCSTLSKKTT